MSRKHLVVLVAALLLLPGRSSAQVATGTPPFSSLSGGPDVVDNANLNVHYSIPVLNKAGRSIPFSYLLSFDSSIWSPQAINGTLTWTPSPGWGLGGISSADTGYVTNQMTVAGPCNGNGQLHYWNIYSNWTYYDPSGTAHQFLGSVSTWSSSFGCGSGPGSSSSGVAPDGSGYTMSFNAAPGATVYARSGLTISPALPQYFISSRSLEDTNGNEVTISVSNGTTSYYDTLNGSTAALTISGGGTPSSPLLLAYTNPSGGSSTYTVNYQAYTVKTNFACSGVSEYGPQSQNLVSSISLPDGTSYSFTYEATPGYSGDITGRVQSVTLPAGGALTYTYSGGSNGIICADGSTAGLTRQTPDGTWTYTRTGSTPSWTTNITDPQSNLTVINFETIYETERKIYQGSGTLLATLDTCYNGSASPCVTTPINYTAITQIMVTTTLPVPGGNLLSETNTDYNTYGLPTEVDQYAYGSGAVGGLVRKTLTTYASLENDIFDRPASIQVQASGSTVAQTLAVYDCNSPTSPCVTPIAGTPQHVSVSGSRGNLTTLSRETGSGYINQTMSYYDAGTVSTATDWAGNIITYSYAGSSCGNSFPTSVTLPKSQSRSMTWNCAGAVLTQLTDENRQNTTYGYGGAGDPNFWGITSLSPPATAITNLSYSATQIQSSLTNSNGLTTTSTNNLDGLGRLLNKQVSGTGLSTPIHTDTTYDALGRRLSVSNPYQSTGDSTYGKDTYLYDALSRITSITHQDNNSTTGFYGAAVPSNGGRSTQLCSSTNYGYGFPTLSSDEAGRMRQSWTDALGRLIEVDEPDPSSGSLTSGNANGTCYIYDALDNLIEVDQGTQQRKYTYDMISRVLTAQTPESKNGTTSFSYFHSGFPCSGDPTAVCSRTDARGIVTTYAYDVLNRLSSKQYTNDPSNTPVANFLYDQTSVTIGSWSSGTLSNPVGRLTETCTSSRVGSCSTVTTATVFSYDAAGRISNYWQCTPFNCGTTAWLVAYFYDGAGNISTWQHPAGFNVTNQFDAAMRLASITQSLNDSAHPPTIATFAYTPFLHAITDGCSGSSCVPRVETYDFNNRLQPVRIQLGISGLSFSNYCLVYNYYSNMSNATNCSVPSQNGATGNNGNALGYFDSNTGDPSLSHTATYTYDYRNRLSTAVAAPVQPATVSYNLTFQSDLYGNTTCFTNGQTNGPCGNWTFNIYNQIASSGYTYDAAGNLTADGTYTFQWDAENHPIKVGNSSGYYYNTFNALGLEAEKVPPGYKSEFVYDTNGRLIGGYAPPPNNRWDGGQILDGDRVIANNICCSPTETIFPHANLVDSTTVVSDHAGNPLGDQLFYPWGQEWTNTGTQYELHFGGMPITDEGNYLALVSRLYSTSQGRWLTPDLLAGDITNPQSLNRYAYAGNNPASFIDPLGLDPCDLHPNSIACGNDARPRPSPGTGLFGLDEFDLAQMGFLPGSSLPSGICPPQYSSCTVWPNGVIIGTSPFGSTAFTFGQSVNGTGNPCSAADFEAGDCSVSGETIIGQTGPLLNGPTIGPFNGSHTIGPAAKPTCRDVLVAELKSGVPGVTESALTGATKAGSILAYDQALSHAAASGLTYPLKSSIFRGWIAFSEDLAAMAEVEVPLAAASIEGAEADYAAISEWLRGGCSMTGN